MRMSETPELLFLKGKYAKIANLGRSVDVFVVGALVFLGRTNDAEVLFKKWRSSLTADDIVIGSFFLAIGWTRASEFQKAQIYLREQFRLRHHLQRPANRMFVFQAFGFYRYFTSRYRRSFLWANRAWQISLSEDFILGQILSCDLLAHSMFQVGEIERGFNQLERAKELAERFGRTALVASLEVSQMTYEAQFGLNPTRILARLSRQYLRTKRSRDTYTKANLGIELCQQLAIRGQVRKAKLVLQDLRKEVFRHGHRRQRSLWYTRAAYCEWLAGDPVRAAAFLDEAVGVLDKENDLSLFLQVLIFQEKVSGTRTPLIESLGHKVGSLIAVRQLRRRQPSVARSVARSNSSNDPQDPFGNLLDSLSRPGESKLENFQNLVDLGLLGLLSERAFASEDGTGVTRNACPKKAMLTDVLPESLLLVESGNTLFVQSGMTSLLRRCLLLIADRPMTKDELVKEIWGYTYEPLRHDALIHAVLSRLRKYISPYSAWIQKSGDRYRLDPEVSVQSFRHLPATTKPTQAVPVIPEFNLNYRQLRILNELKSRSYLSARECIEILKTTKITVNRDLKALVDLNLISTSGRGKATRYHAAH